MHIPHIPLVQRGTVSASAIDLALALNSGKVFIAGMDLAIRDIRTHIRPYSFDRLLEERASRLNPVYSQAYVRSAGIAGGGSHQIYASWFGAQLKAYPDRLYTLGSNNQVFQGLKEWKNLTTEDTEGKREKNDNPSRAAPPSLFLPPHSSVLSVSSVVDLSSDPAAYAVAILGEALANPETKGPVTEELSGLLFPGRRNVEATELANEISVLAKPYCGSAPVELSNG
jgi:hypothetical protein